MDIEAVRSLYDQDQRRNLQEYGSRRDVMPNGVVRTVDQVSRMSWVIYHDLNESNIDEAINEQIEFYSGLGHEFEWKVFDHDRPADMRERLAKKGFEVGDAEALLILDLENLPDMLSQPVTNDIRKIVDAEGIRAALSVPSRVFGGDLDEFPPDRVDDFHERMVAEIQTAPEGMSIYAAFDNDKPVSTAWVRFPDNSQFASLWGGATLKPYRSRGYYTGLLAIRAQEAVKRGRRYLCVDASPMSSPILQKRGFQLISYSYPCQWKGNPS